MSDAIRAAFDRERRAQEEHHAAALALSVAVAAYRAEHPAPEGQYWRLAYYPDEVRGTMVLTELSADCTVEDDGVECGAVAVSWDTDGQALCRQHLEER